VDLALIAGAGLMGLAGSPHCAAMCGAPCTAVTRRCDGARPGAAWTGFIAGRALGYMAAGAAVAGGVQAFAMLGQLAPALRPLWALFHLAAFGLGVWLLATGRLPARFASFGRAVPVPAPAIGGGWQRMAGPLRAAGAGSLWVGLPCGLLQSALIVAALASTPLSGAIAMAAFAATSSVGLAAIPALWAGSSANARAGVWAIRAAGAALLASAGWALGHGLWERIAALCAAL
jgi:sulfite exporter TauE/SafE